jgi:hypothetical protein
MSVLNRGNLNLNGSRDVEDKRKNLVSTKQKELLSKLLVILQEEHPSFYYLSTAEISHEIMRYTEELEKLSHDEMLLLKNLTARDVQMMLSLHN